MDSVDSMDNRPPQVPAESARTGFLSITGSKVRVLQETPLHLARGTAVTTAVPFAILAPLSRMAPSRVEPAGAATMDGMDPDTREGNP